MLLFLLLVFLLILGWLIYEGASKVGNPYQELKWLQTPEPETKTGLDQSITPILEPHLFPSNPQIDPKHIITSKPSKSEIWKKQKDELLEKGVKSLYHFTHKSNVESIRQKGLYPWPALIANLPNPIFGSSEESRSMDKDAGLQDYVRLSFCRSHPMGYRRFVNDAKVFEISIDCLENADFKISSMNAVDHSAKIGDGFDAISLVHLEYALAPNDEIKRMKEDGNSLPRKFQQAEVMILNHVHPRFILNVYDLYS